MKNFQMNLIVALLVALTGAGIFLFSTNHLFAEIIFVCAGIEGCIALINYFRQRNK